MNVLSLFDGIGCARLSLINAGVNFDKYYYSEICEHAKTVSEQYHDRRLGLGDVTNWREWRIDWSSIDVIFAGSPCQGFSRAGNELNFNDPRSRLFFEFVNILNHVRAKNSGVKFMLENVKMRQEYQDVITNRLGVEPLEFDGKNGFLQSRPRLFWSNFISSDLKIEGPYHCINDALSDDNNHQIKNIYNNNRVKGVTENDRGYRPHRGDSRKTGISELGRVLKKTARYCDTITTSHRPKIAVNDSGEFRIATIAECERLTGLPAGYTSLLSDTQALKCIGNGWHVGVTSKLCEGLAKTATLNL